MAKKAKSAKGAAEKARRNTKRSKAITKSPKALTVKPSTPEPSQGAVTETDLAILEAARVEAHSDLAELREALLTVIRRSNALELSLSLARRKANTVPGGITYLDRDGKQQGLPLPQSVLRGAWAEQWKAEYSQWVRSIRDAMDAVGRPAVAAVMDPNSHPHPALCWTATVRDQLNRLQASLHPMEQGLDGMGFIRAGANSLPEAFRWPLSSLRRLLGQLEAVAPTFTPVAKRADSAKPGTPEHDHEEWKPASHFPLKMRGRLRHAARAGRKTKRVRKKTVDGAVLYSLSDARRWWGAELE